MKALTDRQDQIDDSIEFLSAWRVADGTYVYFAEEVQKPFGNITEDDLVKLYELRNRQTDNKEETEELQACAYSHWCNIATEEIDMQPEIDAFAAEIVANMSPEDVRTYERDNWIYGISTMPWDGWQMGVWVEKLMDAVDAAVALQK